jgi:hypothetical protein
MSASPADHHIGKDVPEIEPPHPTWPPWVWEADREACGVDLSGAVPDRTGAGCRRRAAVTRFDRLMRSVATC